MLFDQIEGKHRSRRRSKLAVQQKSIFTKRIITNTTKRQVKRSLHLMEPQDHGRAVMANIKSPLLQSTLWKLTHRTSNSSGKWICKCISQRSKRRIPQRNDCGNSNLGRGNLYGQNPHGQHSSGKYQYNEDHHNHKKMETIKNLIGEIQAQINQLSLIRP